MVLDKRSVGSSIRSVYRPTQPCGRDHEGKVIYREQVPAELLREHVYCYWELATTEPLENQFSYRVVADGCIDIFLEPTAADRSFVVGFQKSFMAFDLGRSFRYVGIRFLPGMFPHLFNVDASQLLNKYVRLDEQVPELAHSIAKRISADDDLRSYGTAFDAILTENRCIDTYPDRRFYRSLVELMRRRGQVGLKNELAFGLSPRQLRRYFQQYVGVSPKAFAQVIRFQGILNAKPSSACLAKSPDLSVGGYYDQNHFIKEFKRFYGVTPSQAFGR